MRALRPLAAFLTVVGPATLLLGCGCDGVQCDVCSGIPITVQVVDATTGQPIADATVTVDGRACEHRPAANQVDGVYGCEGSAGEREIAVSAPGHAPQTKTVELPEDEDESCCSCGPQTSTKVELPPA